MTLTEDPNVQMVLMPFSAKGAEEDRSAPRDSALGKRGYNKWSAEGAKSLRPGLIPPLQGLGAMAILFPGALPQAILFRPIGASGENDSCLS